MKPNNSTVLKSTSLIPMSNLEMGQFPKISRPTIVPIEEVETTLGTSIITMCLGAVLALPCPLCFL